MRRIVVIGDTGCRLIKGPHAGFYQACNDDGQYPFARIASQAATWRPDLVIHVGDYLYRESPCPPGLRGCEGSPWGYGEDAWKADFFHPASPLLRAAPWAMARGNHESCARGGQGWWRLLDPRPLQRGRDCIEPKEDTEGDYSDQYAIPLGDGAQLIVMDTSNTTRASIAPGSRRDNRYADLYRKVDELAKRARYSIGVNHQPIYGLGANKDSKGEVVLFGGNQGLQSVFGRIEPRMLPPTVSVMLSGHIHLWEQVSFSSSHPTQFVSGFSGTAEDTAPLPRELPKGVMPGPGAEVQNFSSWTNGFGYMTLERQSDDTWKVGVWSVSGTLVNTCIISGRKSVCVRKRIE